MVSREEIADLHVVAIRAEVESPKPVVLSKGVAEVERVALHSLFACKRRREGNDIGSYVTEVEVYFDLLRRTAVIWFAGCGHGTELMGVTCTGGVAVGTLCRQQAVV